MSHGGKDGRLPPLHSPHPPASAFAHALTDILVSGPTAVRACVVGSQLQRQQGLKDNRGDSALGLPTVHGVFAALAAPSPLLQQQHSSSRWAAQQQHSEHSSQFNPHVSRCCRDRAQLLRLELQQQQQQEELQCQRLLLVPDPHDLCTFPFLLLPLLRLPGALLPFQPRKKVAWERGPVTMEDLYSIHPGISRAGGGGAPAAASEASGVAGGAGSPPPPPPPHPPPPPAAADLTELVKAQIAGHPRYPSLLSAYIECRKVGAPPEVATLLEEIGRERCAAAAAGGEVGMDPELDEFMPASRHAEAYCGVLERYKEELSRPFDEAASFLSSVRTQLTTLCGGASLSGTHPSHASPILSLSIRGYSVQPAWRVSDAGVRWSKVLGVCKLARVGFLSKKMPRRVWRRHSLWRGNPAPQPPHFWDTDATDLGQEHSSRLADRELKEMLLKKYSGCLSRLRSEFLKKRKKGKLPKDARSALMDWWNTHYRWPYPTEEDKVRLAAMTGLDPKQINNWFINQRKRHWKPSEDMRFALMEGVTGGGSSSGTTLYFDTGTIGP
ncbi:hypothetical protein HU200_020317 [Digitaria exilis]|nr:hypothetical protein HU200_020317 [Digitaria exilis]